MGADIVATLSLAAAIGSGSFMISKSKMFAFLRDWAGRRKQDGLPWAWLSGVLICPYCTGTWLSLAAVAVAFTEVYQARRTSLAQGLLFARRPVRLRTGERSTRRRAPR